MENIKDAIRAYLFEEICDEAETGVLEGPTPLITSGIVDSVSTLQLVEFIEKTFGIEFQPHEVDHDNLDSLDKIEEFVKSKRN